LDASGASELAADTLGAKICGDPLWLADALRKLRTTENHRASAGLLSTHPPVAERIRRLEALAYGAYI
jgi:Zn-dependent protease with chaperone function